MTKSGFQVLMVRNLMNAIIVLGFREGGEVLHSRIREAARAYASVEGNQKVLVVSGGYPVDGTRVSEAAYMKDSLIKKYGIAEESVFREDRSFDTLDNILESLVICRRLNGAPLYWSDNGWGETPEVLERLRKITIVTSDFHVARVQHICEFFSLGDLCDWEVLSAKSGIEDSMFEKELQIVDSYTAVFLKKYKKTARYTIRTWPC